MDDCPVCITLMWMSDIITEVRGELSYENKCLASSVSTKVSEARKKAQSGVQSVD
jgi:hypothetical protein